MPVKKHVMSGRENEAVVEYRYDTRTRHLLRLKSPALADITVDYTDVPPERQGGTAVKLLCASCLYCFADTLASALSARNVPVKSLTGRAFSRIEQEAGSRSRVAGINLVLEVDVDDSDAPVLEMCRNFMNLGCLITNSLKQSVAFTYEIKRVGQGESPPQT